jgi:hypothetical protein
MRPRTVRAAIDEAARRAGVPARQLIHVRTQEHLATLPARYRRLAQRVLLQLPDDWDSHIALWQMIEGDTGDTGDQHYYASTRLIATDEGAGQQWDVRLSTARLDPLPDQAVCGVIAHELAHVASALPHGPGRCIGICEDRANAIARWWGFGRELDAATRYDRQRLGYDEAPRFGTALATPMARVSSTRRALVLAALIVAVVLGGVAAVDWLLMDHVIE